MLHKLPLCDNPSGHYCKSCRSSGVSHCSDPSYVGELQGCAAMKPMACHETCSHQSKETTDKE